MISTTAGVKVSVQGPFSQIKNGQVSLSVINREHDGKRVKFTNAWENLKLERLFMVELSQKYVINSGYPDLLKLEKLFKVYKLFFWLTQYPGLLEHKINPQERIWTVQQHAP